MTTPELFDLQGLVAMVTGGNGGIGRAIALGMAQAGAAVAVLARNERKNAAVLDELETLGNPAMTLKLDVSDRSALQPAIQQVESELGPVSILVNNAGIASLSGGILNEAPEDWDRVIEVQLNAVFLLSKYAAQSMVERKRGKIINIASMTSYFGNPLIPSYGAAKAAVVQLTKSMAIELAPHNIQVNAIAPGWISTDLAAPAKDLPLNEQIIARTPAGRWGEPEELAGTAVFLASHASDFVTGATIPVDGGYSVS